VSVVVELVVGSDRAGVLTDAEGVVKLPVIELDPLEPQPANSTAHRAASVMIQHRALWVIVSPRSSPRLLFFALFLEFLS
jgi:hypothetical protein